MLRQRIHSNGVAALRFLPDTQLHHFGITAPCNFEDAGIGTTVLNVTDRLPLRFVENGILCVNLIIILLYYS